MDTEVSIRGVDFAAIANMYFSENVSTAGPESSEASTTVIKRIDASEAATTTLVARSSQAMMKMMEASKAATKPSPAKFSEGNVVFEMAAASNWRKMGSKDWASFGPASKEVVKDAGGFIEYRNVCVSSRDGILVPESKRGYASEEEMSSGAARWSTGALKATSPSNARILPEAKKGNAYLLSGAAFFGCCWRQEVKRRNPSHWLFGHLPLFAATTLVGILPTLDHVVFHQCGNSVDPEWPLANAIMDFTDLRAYEVGLYPRNGVNRVLVAAPGRPFKYEEMKSSKEALVCAERMFFMPHPQVAHSYIGITTPQVVDQWRRTVDAYLSKGQSNVCGSPKSPKGKKRELPGCNATCSRGLRVAVWQRSNRLITNIDEVEAFVARYTDEPVARLTADAGTPPDEQMMNFRCFDVLIAVHGSQLTGMIFTPSSTQVFIEIQALPGSDDVGCPFCVAGRVWAGGWIISYGHLPVKPYTSTVDEELAKKWDACFARVPLGKGSEKESYITTGKANLKKDAACNLMSMRGGAFHDRLVNLEYLKEDFEAALRSICNCGAESVGHRCGLTFLPEARLRARSRRPAPR